MIIFRFFCFTFFCKAAFLSICFVCTIASAQQPLGLGIVKPRIAVGTTLYLYSGQLIDDLLHHAATKDSITFIQGQYNIEIGTAPPWLVPEAIKLDYDIFQLRVITIARNWIEVIVNKQTGRTAWVDRNAVEYRGWPEFFLEVFSIELIEPFKNPLRLKPMEQSAIVANPGWLPLQPIAVQGDWIKVSLDQEKPGSIPKTGWIRWKKGNQVLITWSPLS